MHVHLVPTFPPTSLAWPLQNFVGTLQARKEAWLLSQQRRRLAGAASAGTPAPETRRIAGADRLVRRSPTFVCDLACSMVRQVCASPRERPAWATSHTSARASTTEHHRPRLRRVIFVLAGCAHSSGRGFSDILWAPEIAPVQRRRSSCTCLANLSTRRLLSASKAPQDPPL